LTATSTLTTIKRIFIITFSQQQWLHE